MIPNACTEQQFLGDIKNHTLQIILADGVYRHLRFRRPGTVCYGFDIVTWPGYLCFSGDIGCFVFSRVEDMLKFFRDGGTCEPLRINPQYWSEKLQATDKNGGYKAFSYERFREVVNQIVAEDEDATKELKEAVEEMLDSPCGLETAEACYQAVAEFEWEGEQYFTDFFEQSLDEYTFHYIWCCYALVWGVRQYDAAQAANTKPASAGAGGGS
jgi:hypothetical protein